MLHGCLVVSSIEKGGRGGYLSQGERAEFTPRRKGGNFHVSQHLLSMIEGINSCAFNLRHKKNPEKQFL